MTVKGTGSGWASPSTVTCRSSMASSRAAWVLGGVRLISSASMMSVKIGPGRNRKSLPSRMSWPVTSDGMRSGVNCTRLNSRSRAAEMALTISVLATPGTPSSSTWPLANRAATRPDRAPSWPTTTLPTSSRTRSRAARALSAAAVSPDGMLGEATGGGGSTAPAPAMLPGPVASTGAEGVDGDW
jgi:hypothetical protein